MRLASLVILVVALSLATTVFAQSGGGSDQSPPPDDQGAPAPEDQAPAGPILQPSDTSPVICDPNAPGFRYLEVRGSGFDAWSTQHLVGSLFDASGAAREQWNSVWVSPQGRLTLEVNLCADPIQKHPALDAGDYTVAVGQGNGAPIATADISLAPPPEPGAAPEQTAPMPAGTPISRSSTLLTPTPFTYVIPQIQAQPSLTPIPIPGVSTATPVAGPRSGAGSLQQPLPLGAPGNLVDDWQLVIQGVTPDAYTGIKAEMPLAPAPASDQRDYVVRAQATYLGQGTGVFGSVRIGLYSTATGLTYDQLSNSCGPIPDPLTPNVVTQGQAERGNVCFVVRAGDIGSLIAFDNQSNAADRVYFRLQ